MSMRVVEDNRREFPGSLMVELPVALKEIWGGDFELAVDPKKLDIPLVCANFVVSREGIFNLRKDSGGAPISQGNRADAFGMALLRSYADAVMVGPGTLISEPTHIWNTGYIFDKFSQMRGLMGLRGEFEAFRKALGRKTKNPPTFFMANSGNIDFGAAVFKPDSGIETYVVTGERGKAAIQAANPAYKNVLVFGGDSLDERAMLQYLRQEMGIEFLLHEGGRRVIEALVRKSLVTQFQLTRMAVSPRGDLSPDNTQYLFETPDHRMPREAKVLSSRTDTTQNATITTFDTRGVNHM
jgi:riboflavin biosynthesis pyrimidine reductase